MHGALASIPSTSQTAVVTLKYSATFRRSWCSKPPAPKPSPPHSVLSRLPSSHQQLLILCLEFTVLLLWVEPRNEVRPSVPLSTLLSRPYHIHTLSLSLVRWGPMALTSLWKMLCCSTWLSTRGRSVPKPWLLSLSWWEGGETPGRRCGLSAD